ncbi:Uncharacterised protein [Vibrio cholerae]|uniref:Uncharacterized protein n=1 Tax=Vibrio cholerae TaxID=666 RepID=A0A655PS10_VIBCL|nr:Uncharacterised protein [Vibrio cholerae]
MREIRTANTAVKQHITHKRQTCRFTKQHNMTWCMSGSMDNLQSLLTKVDHITIIEPLIRFKGFSKRKAKHFALPFEPL